MDCHRDKNRVVTSTVRTGVWIFAVAPIYTHSLSLRLEKMNWLLRSKFPPGGGDATQGTFFYLILPWKGQPPLAGFLRDFRRVPMLVVQRLLLRQRGLTFGFFNDMYRSGTALQMG
jgi:hypothetical protein